MDLMTLGQIAKRLNVPNHQVKYAIERYRIPPTSRVGIIRVWDTDGFERIKRALMRTKGATLRGPHD